MLIWLRVLIVYTYMYIQSVLFYPTQHTYMNKQPVLLYPNQHDSSPYGITMERMHSVTGWLYSLLTLKRQPKIAANDI